MRKCKFAIFSDGEIKKFDCDFLRANIEQIKKIFRDDNCNEDSYKEWDEALSNCKCKDQDV